MVWDIGKSKMALTEKWNSGFWQYGTVLRVNMRGKRVEIRRQAGRLL